MTELTERGLQNLNDARFVRDHFIPLARAERQWNIVVYEAHRATELLVRGMICQRGLTPCRHHEISQHVNFLLQNTPSSGRPNLPFTIGAYNRNNGYGLVLYADNFELLKLVAGVYTSLACGPTDPLFTGRDKFKLQIENSQITVSVDDRCVATVTDSTLIGPFIVIDNSFVLQPDITRARMLRKISNQLSKHRDGAYYGEQQYTQTDAAHAVTYMNECFQITAAFFALEYLSTIKAPA